MPNEMKCQREAVSRPDLLREYFPPPHIPPKARGLRHAPRPAGSMVFPCLHAQCSLGFTRDGSAPQKISLRK